MKPVDALIELLDRVGANHGAAVLVNDDELRQWPSEAVNAMKSQKLVTKARPAASAICPGCEHECVMPVHTAPAAARSAVSFIVRDKRSEINRVTVSAGRRSSGSATLTWCADLSRPVWDGCVRKKQKARMGAGIKICRAGKSDHLSPSSSQHLGVLLGVF